MTMRPYGSRSGGDCSFDKYLAFMQTSLQNASQMAMMAKKIDAKRAKKWGIVDMTVEPVGTY